jgi:hypothetical protein
VILAAKHNEEALVLSLVEDQDDVFLEGRQNQYLPDHQLFTRTTHRIISIVSECLPHIAKTLPLTTTIIIDVIIIVVISTTTIMKGYTKRCSWCMSMPTLGGKW